MKVPECVKRFNHNRLIQFEIRIQSLKPYQGNIKVSNLRGAILTIQIVITHKSSNDEWNNIHG